jgi:anti-repressor protein
MNSRINKSNQPNAPFFSMHTASALLDSQDCYPVDFDLAWEWLGYSRKDNAKTSLFGANFEEGIDFLIEKELGTLAVPRPCGKIWLTVDCLKSWAMMAGTEQGKKVRNYFLECERIAKQPVKVPTPKELAYMLIAAEDAREKAEAEAKALAAQIEADEPATIVGKLIESAEKGNCRIGDFAKFLKMGQNRYFQELRECKIIMMNSTLPYQRFLDAGYFAVTKTLSNGLWYHVAMITPKGKTYLAKRHREYIRARFVEVTIEAQVEALV